MIALRHCRPAALPTKATPFLVEYGNALRSVACHRQPKARVGPCLYLCTTPGATRASVANEEKQKNAVEAVGPVRRVFRLLDTKEVKELRAFAHQQKNDIVIQHVGKLGVTPTVVRNLSDALEANELIKVRILSNCPEELEDMRLQLEQKTEAQVIEKIGGTMLLYRPSLNKLAAAEKKKQVQKQGPRPGQRRSTSRRY